MELCHLTLRYYTWRVIAVKKNALSSHKPSQSVYLYDARFELQIAYSSWKRNVLSCFTRIRMNQHFEQQQRYELHQVAKDAKLKQQCVAIYKCLDLVKSLQMTIANND